jgi:hypothetical protein
MRRHYQNALDAQDACNLSGIVIAMNAAIADLWVEARKHGHGTRWVNQHPICRLFAEQVAHLTSGCAYSDAYQACLDACKVAV